MCQETAIFTHFYQGNVTYEGAYVTAMLQKLNSKTGGENGNAS